MAIEHNPKWADEKRALKKVQMHFVFKEQLNKRIRHDAADENLNPSDIIRKVVGLSYQRIQRPRIGLSFNGDDLRFLAQRYGVDDEKNIRRRVLEEVTLYYQSDDESKTKITTGKTKGK
ncbi:MAG: hypothetical protein KBT88_11470 [Gammaproteobacteria bacterium]|nr:hypothetical protein [Gammaproteobacteria bacterium]MBQ0840395.1 hypothetical protein [Gammaproteobacteria bacterium]